MEVFRSPEVLGSLLRLLLMSELMHRFNIRRYPLEKYNDNQGSDCFFSNFGSLRGKYVKQSLNLLIFNCE